MPGRQVLAKIAMLGAPIGRKLRGMVPVRIGGDDDSAAASSSRAGGPSFKQRFQDFFPWKEGGERPAFLQRLVPARFNLNLEMARKTKPTPYPHLPFHALRSTQLLSSIIVMSILSYFLWQLHHDGYGSPWTFILVKSRLSLIYQSSC